MHELALSGTMATDDARRISAAFAGERGRLTRWLRRRVSDPGEVEDVLQDVFSELVQAYRVLTPIDDLSAWLFRVTRNRVIDLFRRKKPVALEDQAPVGEDGESMSIDDFLPSSDAGPEAAYAREVMMDLLGEAVEELPEDQRSVFLAHEIDGLSFREISALTGVGVNTLLSRKHLAVKQLRKRLQAVYDEFGDIRGE
jgi:RNA polymerase sigma factor (sigma-70 family)